MLTVGSSRSDWLRGLDDWGSAAVSSEDVAVVAQEAEADAIVAVASPYEHEEAMETEEEGEEEEIVEDATGEGKGTEDTPARGTRC